MTTSSIRRPAALVACTAALLMAGCVVAPVGPYSHGYGYGDVVAVAPPPPQQEVVGVAPIVGHVWIGGYWGWGGGRHHWVPGRWTAPRAGHVWMPHAWVRAGNGWRLNPGHWQRH